MIFMQNGNFTAGSLIVVLGVIIILAKYFRWDWFVNHYKVTDIVDALGKKGVNLLYYLTGLILIVLGILIILGIIGN